MSIIGQTICQTLWLGAHNLALSGVVPVKCRPLPTHITCSAYLLTPSYDYSPCILCSTREPQFNISQSFFSTHITFYSLIWNSQYILFRKKCFSFSTYKQKTKRPIFRTRILSIRMQTFNRLLMLFTYNISTPYVPQFFRFLTYQVQYPPLEPIEILPIQCNGRATKIIITCNINDRQFDLVHV